MTHRITSLPLQVKLCMVLGSVIHPGGLFGSICYLTQFDAHRPRTERLAHAGPPDHRRFGRKRHAAGASGAAHVFAVVLRRQPQRHHQWRQNNAVCFCSLSPSVLYYRTATRPPIMRCSDHSLKCRLPCRCANAASQYLGRNKVSVPPIAPAAPPPPFIFNAGDSYSAVAGAAMCPTHPGKDPLARLQWGMPTSSLDFSKAWWPRSVIKSHTAAHRGLSHFISVARTG